MALPAPLYGIYLHEASTAMLMVAPSPLPLTLVVQPLVPQVVVLELLQVVQEVPPCQANYNTTPTFVGTDLALAQTLVETLAAVEACWSVVLQSNPRSYACSGHYSTSPSARPLTLPQDPCYLYAGCCAK